MLLPSRPLRLLAVLACLTPALLAHDGDPKLLDKQPMHRGPGWRNATRRASDGNLTGIQPGIAFPSNNVTLFSWLSLPDFGVPGGGNGNSCFGYTSPSGREYAIMGLSTGTAFVEVTQPGNPVIVQQIPGPQSLWRDMRVFQNYCYSISEGGGGIQVMNLANIDNGVVTTLPSINDDGNDKTHTIAINTDSGYLYRAGGNGAGLRIYNLNVTPGAPQRVGTWADKYVHEAQIVNWTSGPHAGKEIAFICGGLNGGFQDTGLDVLDVTNKGSILPLGVSSHYTWASPGYSHQAWLSPDRQYIYLNDELDEQNFGLTTRTYFWNATNPAALSSPGFFTSPNTAVGHNLYTKANLIYEANYRSGLRVFSTSNPGTPTAPVEVAYFDTYPNDDANAFNGLWNNYPYFASGVVIGSDIEKGLFIWWVGAPLLAFDLPNGTPAAINPSGQMVRVNVLENTPGALQPGTAKLHIDTGSGFVASDLLPVSGNQYDAVFPSTPCGTAMAYYFSAESTNGIVWSDPMGAPSTVHTAVSSVGSSVVASDSFEAVSGWVSGAAGDNATAGLWTRVNPVGTAAQPEDDHTSVGTNCWVTGQGVVGGLIGDADVDGGHTTLVSATLNLAGITDPHIAYWRWYSNDQGSNPGNDVFTIAISNNGGANWVNVETVGPAGAEAIGGWLRHQFRVADFVAPTANVKMRFVADDAGNGSIIEAAIDDFEVIELDCGDIDAMCFGDGSGPLPCPCANSGVAGHGCENSDGTGGSLLIPSGTASVSADTFVLTASGERPTAISIFLQGSVEIAPVIFGDGIRCAGGALKRLYTKNAVGGVVTGPTGAEPSVTTRSAAIGDPIPAQATRIYMVYYRDGDPAFCPMPPGNTFNSSNGLRVVWAP